MRDKNKFFSTSTHLPGTVPTGPAATAGRAGNTKRTSGTVAMTVAGPSANNNKSFLLTDNNR